MNILHLQYKRPSFSTIRISKGEELKGYSWYSFLSIVKNGPFPAFFYFCLFNTVDSKYMFNGNISDQWIRTADLWCWKQPLYQQSKNHCPFLKYFCLREIIVASSSKGRASLHIRNTYPDVLKLFQHFLPTMLPTCVNEKLLFVLLKKSKVSI